MSAHQNQRQRLQDVTEAFLALSTGKQLARYEIFGSPRKGWHSHLLARLVAEELIIQHGSSANRQDTVYEAVDGGWFGSMAEEEIRLAEWYFKRGVIPGSLSAPDQEPQTELVTTRDAKVAPHAPKPEEVTSDGDPLQQKILDTLVLCAENIVYMRDRIEDLHAKVDALIGNPDDLV